MKHLRKMTLVIGFVLISIGSASARNLTVEEKCAIDKAKATAAHFKCLTRVQIKGIKKCLGEAEIDALAAACATKHSIKFDRAEARAVSKGGQCATTGDAIEHQGIVDVSVARMWNLWIIVILICAENS